MSDSVNVIPENEEKYFDEEGRPKMSPQRRAHVYRVLRRSVKQFAKEKRELVLKNAEFAKLCVLDAFQGRLSNGLANNSKKAKWIYQIFCIQTSDWMFKSVVIASTLHTFSIFFEPANSCPNSILFKLFQFTVFAIFAVDIGLKMSYEGVNEYFRHDWQQLYVANLVIGVLDLCICGCTYYANPLRPLAGVLRARRGRKFFEILKKMIPGMMQNLVPVIFFVVIVMVLCSILFDTHVSEFRSTAYTFYNWLFLVLTNDTFDRLLPENLFLNLTYLMFFFPAIYIGQRFLFNLIIGDTYETFRSYVKKQLKKEKLKELQGLTKAFAVLDHEKRGKISDVQWNALISKLYPELSEEALALYFELISGGNANITILQFLSLRSAMSFNFSYSKQSTNVLIASIRKVYNQVLDYYQNYEIKISEKVSTLATKVLAICEEYLVWERINQVDLIILSLELSDFPLVMVRAYTILTACQLLLGIHVVEFLLRLCSHRGKFGEVSKDLNTISLLYIGGCIGCIGYYLITACFPFYFTTEWLHTKVLLTVPLGGFEISPYKLLMLLRLSRCLRIANNSDELKDFNAALFDIFPTLVETFVFTFIVTYMFGTLGNILFGEYLEAWQTPLLSIVKAQQLTFMVSFLSSMEEAMTAVHPFVGITYFVIFLISSLTVSNIALSIIIDLHSNVLDMKSKKERESNRKKMDLLFNKLVDQARIRALFRSTSSSSAASSTHSMSHDQVVATNRAPLNFKNLRLSAFQSSDVRHFITHSGSDTSKQQYGFTLEDLQSCQKYANIDLSKFFRESHRNHKDVNWEVNFIKSLQDLGLHEERICQKGELIYTNDTRANRLCLLVQGSVVLIKPTSEECVIYATKFLGWEALQPNGYYQTSCYVDEDNAKFMIFKQDDIAHNIANDLVGSIIQMVYKSYTEIEHNFGKKKFRRQASRASYYVIPKEEQEDTGGNMSRLSSSEMILSSTSVSPKAMDANTLAQASTSPEK